MCVSPVSFFSHSPLSFLYLLPFALRLFARFFPPPLPEFFTSPCAVCACARPLSSTPSLLPTTLFFHSLFSSCFCFSSLFSHCVCVCDPFSPFQFSFVFGGISLVGLHWFISCFDLFLNSLSLSDRVLPRNKEKKACIHLHTYIYIYILSRTEDPEDAAVSPVSSPSSPLQAHAHVPAYLLICLLLATVSRFTLSYPPPLITGDCTRTSLWPSCVCICPQPSTISSLIFVTPHFSVIKSAPISPSPQTHTHTHTSPNSVARLHLCACRCVTRVLSPSRSETEELQREGGEGNETFTHTRTHARENKKNGAPQQRNNHCLSLSSVYYYYSSSASPSPRPIPFLLFCLCLLSVLCFLFFICFVSSLERREKQPHHRKKGKREKKASLSSNVSFSFSLQRSRRLFFFLFRERVTPKGGGMKSADIQEQQERKGSFVVQGMR